MVKNLMLVLVSLTFAAGAFAEKPSWAGNKTKAEREQMKEEWRAKRERYDDDDDDRDEEYDRDEDDWEDRKERAKSKYGGKQKDKYGKREDDENDDDRDQDEDRDDDWEDRKEKAKEKHAGKHRDKHEYEDGMESDERELNEAQQRKRDGIAPGRSGENASPSEQGRANAKKWWEFWKSDD